MASLSLAALLVVLAVLLPTVAAQGADVPPVVIMHGILGKASKMDAVKDWIREILPGKGRLLCS